MGVLRDIYDQFKGFLHHGPSMAPFHEAMVGMHEMHERLIEELQAANARLHAALNKLELRVEAAFPQRSQEPPVYISPPHELNQDSSESKLPASLVQQAALFAVTKAVPDDASSLSTTSESAPSESTSTDQPGAMPEPNPAEPQKDEGPLLPAAPEAASAGSTEPVSPANQGG